MDSLTHTRAMMPTRFSVPLPTKDELDRLTDEELFFEVESTQPSQLEEK